MERDRRGAELLFQALTEREEKNSVALASDESFGGWTKTIHRPSPLRGRRRGASPSTAPSSKPAPTPTASPAPEPRSPAKAGSYSAPIAVSEVREVNDARSEYGPAHLAGLDRRRRLHFSRHSSP